MNDDVGRLEAAMETARRRVHEVAAGHPELEMRVGDVIATAVALGHARERAAQGLRATVTAPKKAWWRKLFS